MQKIMFEHKRFGLEQAVIAGLKDNTRRQVCFPKGVNDADVESAVMGIDKKGRVYFTFATATESFDVYPRYQIGERVAVAQSYGRIPMEHFMEGISDPTKRYFQEQLVRQAAAYRNKSFALASLMPYVIEITDIKAERLQQISDEDCLREGITKWLDCYIVTGIMEHHGQNNRCFDTPREAFSCLIDHLSGRGTWDKNEWQYAYKFKVTNV